MSTAEIMKFNPREVRVADLDDGYTRIANEIYEAIIGSSLTQNQSKVAHAIIRLTYGYNKKNDRIADSQIAKITNLPRQKVNKAKNELIAMNIIVREANKIGMNKAITEWNFNKCHQSNDNVTKTVTKSVTKVVTRVSPKQGHTKDIISKDNKNNMSSADDGIAPKSKKTKPDYQAVLEAYQEVALDGLPIPDKINKKRKALIDKLFKEIKNPSVETVKKYFTGLMEQVKDKPFYFGGPNRNGWRLNFDYALEVSTLTKTREGAL